ncbi:MAG: response regulator [Lentisphaeria bacterium]|nr:response regulator [Lentisphaeria bacterium]
MPDKPIPRHYKSVDPESQKNQNEYQAMISSIEKRMDPDSNTVLIVDDDKGIRKFVARSIRRYTKNIVVYEAENGKEGLEVLADMRERHSHDPLFIVSDLNMPVMDGWKFIQELRKDYEDKGMEQGIPLIVLSSTSGEKGMAIFRKSVHGEKSHYQPMVAVAKEVCTDPTQYTAQGEKGLVAWIRQFSRHGNDTAFDV